MMNNCDNAKTNPSATIVGADVSSVEFVDKDQVSGVNYGSGQTITYKCVAYPSCPSSVVDIFASGVLTCGLIVWYRTSLRWVDPVEGQEWVELYDGIDINPVHKIREIITDDTAINILQACKLHSVIALSKY